MILATCTQPLDFLTLSISRQGLRPRHMAIQKLVLTEETLKLVALKL